MLRTKSNDELLSLYEAELALTIRNERNLAWYRCVQGEFKFFLEEFPPSADVGKKLLTRRAKSKPAILRKNYSIVRNFLKWYGDELTLKITCLRCSI